MSRWNWMVLTLTLLVLGIGHGQDAPPEAGPLVLLPDTVREGAELIARISGDTPGAQRTLLIRGDGRFVEELATFRLDRQGRARITAALPEAVTAGSYTVELRPPIGAPGGLLDRDPLEVLSPPMLSLSPASAWSGQPIAFELSGLAPGTVVLWADGFPVFGPVATGEATLSGEFELPEGSPGDVPVILENRIGERMLGRAERILERRARTIEAPEIVAATVPETLGRFEDFEITGSLRVPEGTAPSDYRWTLVWRSGDGQSVPVNTTFFQLDEATAFDRVGQATDFSVLATVPELLKNFPSVDLDQVSDLGLAYVLPERGLGGETPFAVSTEVNGWEAITITGRVVDTTTSDPQTGLPEPVEDAIWTIEPKTWLFEEPTAIEQAKASGESFTYTQNIPAALAHGANELALKASPFGCDDTLRRGQTDANGEWSFTFSPDTTWLLNLSSAIATAATDPVNPTSLTPETVYEDEFFVRIAGLHLGRGILIDDGTPNSSRFAFGLRYDFRYDGPATGFRFRERLDGPFDTVLPVGEPLSSVLPELPPFVEERTLETRLFMEHLQRRDPFETETGGPNPPLDVFERLYVFPSRAGTALDDETVTFSLNWNTELFGPVDMVVELERNGVYEQVAVLASAEDLTACEGQGLLETQVAGLATWPLPPGQDSGRIKGRVVAVTANLEELKRNFEIVIERAPTWWQDPTAYANVTIDWRPEEILISASEAPKARDASVQNVPRNVGDLDNENRESATVRQCIESGQIHAVQRRSSTTTSVANRDTDSLGSGSPTPCDDGPSIPVASDERNWAVVGATNTAKNTIDDLRNLADNDPDALSINRVQTILDTGKIPLFRFTWGVPPLASATLGADIWFRAVFAYYVFFDLVADQVRLDALAEPSTGGGLDVFFDLSVIFDLVSASVTAASALGVGMPVVITDNRFDTDLSLPCFRFILDLIVTAKLGWCPFCIKHTIDERVVNERKPSGCSVALFQSVSKGSAQEGLFASVQPGKIDVASDGFGTTTAVYAEATGIQALTMTGGTQGPPEPLQSGRGAMRPAVAWFDAGLGLAAWAQSGLSEQAFDAEPDAEYDDPTECANPDDPDACPPTTPQPFPAVNAQHIVYAVYESGQWGSTENLTPPTSPTGEGGVELAACLAGDPGCPAGGELLAVWQRDTAGDIREQEVKLDYAFFDGATRSWSAVQTIDPASTAKDVQAAPLYVQGEPVVVWVRNPQASATDLALDANELWYQFLEQPAGPQLAPLSDRIASPSVDEYGDGRFAVAFTRSTDLNFIGNRRALWVAFADECSAGVCSWTQIEPRDDFERRLFVENPELAIGEQGGIYVTGRQLGIDGEFLGNETIGVVTGAGDLFSLYLAPGELEAPVQALSDDGAINWQTAIAVDPAVGTLSIFNAKGPSVEAAIGGPVGGKQAAASRAVGAAASKGVTGGATGVFMNLVADTPDFELAEASAADARLAPGEAVSVALTARNLSRPAADPVVVGAWWDGPPGVGAAAGEITLDFSSARVLDDEITVPVPARFREDEPHRLFLHINPRLAVDEGNSSNNMLVLTFGALPVPTNIAPSVDRTGTVAFLDWDPIDDPRVMGFRVYRQAFTSDEILAIGYTTTNGFADLRAIPGERYEYYVTSVSERFFESAPSERVSAFLRPFRTELIFASGFE